MRRRPWFVLAFIVALTLFTGWLSLPTEALDIGGFKQRFPVREGIDLQGGLQVVLEADPPAGQEVDSETLEGTRATIERRVNGLGVSEPVIQTQGDNRIVVELPGVDDPQDAVNILQETALLEIIDPQGSSLPPGAFVNTSLGAAEGGETDATPVAATPAASPAASPIASPATEGGTGPTGPVYSTIVRGDQIADAYVGQDQFGAPVVSFELHGDGADALQAFTQDNLGRPMSIVVDKQVISTATIQGAISNSGQISGMNAAEVNDLVIQLKAGALNVPLKVIQNQTVGPSLGQDSIDRSILAGAIGLGAVALFMIFYYRLPGFLSVVALLIYTSITFAIFKLIPVTLTLAGIAGFILSIGMAVDANVLIFARLKEELRQGRSLGSAIEAGFDHAWPSIRDSNISTMITTFILYLFGNYTGTSIITGFAITLFIGVAVSMFTAITVTRTFLRLLVGVGMARQRWWFGVERGRVAAGAGD
ncbi:MAG: Protein translocase subunit SecD [uncultured Thermomicrobiales bacterium]|uniref:Protein translocase subunit SecD n=1 Tax=uncultured Thermomicrobiales bacterium TaxID=1645740 RepID=A0A6J4U944_9BACT|nr:MAG: Protein translocase subunit SecD [uncultured Thermomicrobiales bacterium]